MRAVRKSKSAILFFILGATACAAQSNAEIGVSKVYSLADDRTTAPFGDKVSINIKNYSRVSPNVGLAGKLTEDGVREAQAHGFVLLIDLRQPDEDGVEMEQQVAGEIGIRYESIPLAKDETAWEQVGAIAALLEDSQNYPVLIHCGSSNRAGAFWALYRARQGVPPIIAIEEGRAGGLTSREPFVRDLLDLPTVDEAP